MRMYFVERQVENTCGDHGEMLVELSLRYLVYIYEYYENS